MNDDEFENKLRALTGALTRPDPTSAWKSEILARARREASAIPFKRTLPPRWLMVGWAAAWIAIAALNLTVPRDPMIGAPRPLAGAAPSAKPPAALSSPELRSQTLIAFHQHLNLNLDLPQ
jgi:hypothetical protein